MYFIYVRSYSKIAYSILKADVDLCSIWAIQREEKKVRGVKTDTTKFYEVYYVLSLTSFIGPCIKIKNI